MDIFLFTQISQTPTSIRPGVDLFYEIMQESFRGVDASIAGHVSKASQFTKQRFRPSRRKNRDNDSDIDIKSNSSFWSDEEQVDQYIEQHYPTRNIPRQRKISRYLSTVNRSLLDRPSDLIADFYLSQLNRNMQESVRHVETIARDKAHQREFIDNRKEKLGRSLSAEHLYQVRKEHLRYKQPSTKPTSFTAEDVADIYKPFVLENYKRKIAIELERRRRARQGQFISTICSPLIYSSQTYSSNNVSKSYRQSRAHNDFVIVSPPNIVHTKEIVMGRARRTLTDDGSSEVIHHIGTVPPPNVVHSKEVVMGRAYRTLTDDGCGEIIHHIGAVSPPPIFSIVKRSSSQPTKKFAATIHDQYEIPFITTIAPPDFANRKHMYTRQERNFSDQTVNDALSTSIQVITV